MYHAIFLEELTTLELVEKIASLYSISPQHIHRLYRQGPTGIHVLVSNEVSTGPCPAEPARGSGQAQDPAQQGLGVTLAWRWGSPACRLLSVVGSVGRAWREGSEARTRRGIAVSPPPQRLHPCLRTLQSWQ